MVEGSAVPSSSAPLLYRPPRRASRKRMYAANLKRNRLYSVTSKERSMATPNPQTNGESNMRQAKGTGKLVDFDRGKAKCQVCNEVWYPPIRPDGWFYQDAFQCPFGCTETELTRNEPYQDTGG